MADLLKNIYHQKFIEQFAADIFAVWPDFPQRKFIDLVFDSEWEKRELKARVRHITHCLKQLLPADYRETIRILSTVADGKSGFEYMIFPDFVEVYGLQDWGTSLPALAHFTPCCSSEFAVRPFIKADSARMMRQMHEWADSDNFHVRRLASEGCRPRLPWAMALPAFKADPQPVLPILERLKNDPEEYVRRSVANNLNDIAKDHPELVLKIAGRWHGDNPQTDRLVKHALRTLLKQGNSRALQLFGYGAPDAAAINNLVLPAAVAIGDILPFSFELRVSSKQPVKIRLEYAIYYLKARGSHSRKVFKISENEYQPNSLTPVKRHQRFQDFTTRKHYPGEHRLAIVVNGQELAESSFLVKKL